MKCAYFTNSPFSAMVKEPPGFGGTEESRMTYCWRARPAVPLDSIRHT